MSTQPQSKLPVMTVIHDQRFEVYGNSKKSLAIIRDTIAGLIVALVAIPLGIGFAIASGLQPEQGVVAGAFAGILGGLFGGSKYQVYGPTAAFIPLLSSIVMNFDVPFLILASLIAGALIALMGLLKLGNHFARIPFSVTVGFTVGIALCIALGQLPDALGSAQPASIHTLEKIEALGKLLTYPSWPALLIAAMTFSIIKVCYKISVFIPGPLLAIALSVLLCQTLLSSHSIPLLADKFGSIHLEFLKLTLPDLGNHHIWQLVAPVLSIVFIASLESLLSARMADRLAKSETVFNPNQELVGQGVVNTIVPLLNGFPCTGAFARTATSIKAGAMSPLASLFQGSFILILMYFFSESIALIPMACVSGLLLYVACSMVKLDELRYVFKKGKIHTFLMIYTAVVTFLTDLLIAVASATTIFYLLNYSSTWSKGRQPR